MLLLIHLFAQIFVAVFMERSSSFATPAGLPPDMNFLWNLWNMGVHLVHSALQDVAMHWGILMPVRRLAA